MKINKATGQINKQLTDACLKLTSIDKNPKVFNSYDFKFAVNIFLDLYRSTRKKHNPDLVKNCLIQNGVNEDWANDYAFMWETICTVKEELR